MFRCALLRLATASVAAAAVLASRASALVQWDESRNQIFVSGAATMTWDSNIYTIAGGDDDLLYHTSLGIEYQRRAGLIGVNGTLGWQSGRFEENSEENFENPSYRLELTKDSGRTTGALSLAAARDSRADPTVNLRTDSWNYDAGLNFKYPVIERYSVSGTLNYNHRDYADNRVLVDLSTYGASTDLFYVFTTERDLIAGYRVRMSETSADTSFTDHAFTAGVSGKILPKLNGTLRGGYQLRAGEGPGAGDHESFTAAGSATWSINKRASLTVQVAKDFSTTSTNVSIDSLGVTADAQYVVNARLSGGGGFSAGRNKFLGSLGAGRDDIYAAGHLNAGYTWSERLRIAATYSYYINWSTVAFSDFERHSVSLTISSRF